MKIGNKFRVEIERKLSVHRLRYWDCVDDNTDYIVRLRLGVTFLPDIRLDFRYI